MGEWWEFIIFPAFIIGMVWFIGHEFDLWDKVKYFFGVLGVGRDKTSMKDLLMSVKSIGFEGIGRFFRRND